MFCTKCGAELPNEALFCFKCGQAQQPGAGAPAEGEFDIAELKFVDHLYGISYEARHGRALLVQSSPTITSRRQANRDVVEKLTAKGWEAFESDKDGYVTRMRRKKAAPQSPVQEVA